MRSAGRAFDGYTGSDAISIVCAGHIAVRLQIDYTGSITIWLYMQESGSLETEIELDDKVRFTTQSCTRDVFYETIENVRYFVKLSATNGAQAEDIPVGIDDLIEFVGDVEMVLDQNGVGIGHKSHSYWTAKLQSEEVLLEDVDHKDLETTIEELASDHGLSLRKSVSLSGRGYEEIGMRSVVVNYNFGTYSDGNEHWVQCPDNPRSYTEWVGGDIGTRDQLKPSSIEIKSVTTERPGVFKKFLFRWRRKLQSLFG